MTTQTNDQTIPQKDILASEPLPRVKTVPLTSKPLFKYIPIMDIFNNKICSKPTFYKHLKAGAFSLYKFGRKSFVDFEEFNNSFHKVKLSNTKQE